MQSQIDPDQEDQGFFKSYKKGLIHALDESNTEYNKLNLFSTNGSNALHIGASLGDVKVIIFAIKCFITKPGIVKFENVKSFVDAFDENEFTALHLACAEGNVKCVKLLIRYGADLQLTSNGKSTALDFAKKHRTNNHKEISSLLVRTSQELEHVGHLMEQLEAQVEVICSQSINNPDVIQELSTLIINKQVNINFTDPVGDTPLHLACLASNEYLMVNLLFFKANTTCTRNEKSRTLLHYACKHMLSIRFFLAKKFPYLLILRDSKGYYPMHLAAKKGDLEFLTFIFDRNVYPLNPLAKDSDDNELAYEIIDMNAQTDAEDTPYTPYTRCPDHRRTKRKSNPEISRPDLEKLQHHYRTESKYKSNVRTKLRRINSKNHHTDLDIKYFEKEYIRTYKDSELKEGDALSQDLSDMGYCIKRISLNEKTMDERTMLHFATANGNLEIVEFLIEICDVHSSFANKACNVYELVNWETEIGLSPLNEALRNKHIEIAEFLLGNNASMHSTTCRVLSIFLEGVDPNESLKFLQNLSKANLTHFMNVLTIEYSTDRPYISTLLHALLREESYKLIAFLLSKKVKLNKEALIIAFTLCIVECRVEHLKVFIQYFPQIEFDEEILTLDKFLNQTDINISFMYEAVKVKGIRLLNLLLQSGADPTIYQPNSLEKNLLFMAYRHSPLDGGELFQTLLEHGVCVNLQEAIEGAGNNAESSCIICLLVLHSIENNLQSLSIKRRLSSVDAFRNPDAQIYKGNVLWDDFGFSVIDLKWIAVCAYIIDNLDSIISDFRIAHSTTFPKKGDLIFRSFVVDRLNTSKIFTSIPTSVLEKSFIGRLSFQNNKLTDVPIELLDLPHLKELNLSDNCLTRIPERQPSLAETDEARLQSEYGCKSLESLDVSNNELDRLPADLFYLPKITEVEASNNKIAFLPHELWLAESLTTLKLNRNLLRHLTKSDFDSIESGFCSSLNPRASFFIRKRVETLPVFQQHMVLPDTNLDNSDNPLNYFPCNDENTSDLSNNTNTGTTGPHSPLSLNSEDRGQSVRHLLPIPNWADYSSLRIIELSFNKFSIFPHDLPCLAPKLQRLDMRNNKLKEMNILLDLPKSLLLILFDNNQLTTLLEHLDPIPCCNLNCSVLPDRGDRNHKPKWCTHHQPDSFPLLQTVSFNNNNLTDLPIEQFLKEDNPNKVDGKKNLVLFPSILALSISENKFTEVPRGIHLLTSLTSLNLAHNRGIKIFPFLLKSLNNLFYINIQGLEIEGIPDYILKGPTPRLISYLASQSHDRKCHRSLKLFFLGDEGKGKSTLMSNLGRGEISLYSPECVSVPLKQRTLGDGYKPTMGLETGIWDLHKPRKWDTTNGTPIQFICWDLAGKQEYFPAYQGFMCERAIYIIVWNITDGYSGAKGLEKWLQCIEQNVPKSSCIIVGTCLNNIKMKKSTIKDMSEFICTMFKKSQYIYPKLIALHFLDCFDEEKLSYLRDNIYIKATKLSAKEKNEEVSILEKLLPVNQIRLLNYITVIKDKSEVQKEIRILNGEQFRGLIQKVWQGDTMEDNEFQNAVRFLHSTGYLMHFEDDPELMDQYIINMEWLCKKFVAVLHSQIPLSQDQQMMKCGVLQKYKVFEILQHLNVHKNDSFKFFSFMKKFEVLIELSDKFFVFPSLLPKNKSLATQLTLKFNLSANNSNSIDSIFCPRIENETTNSLSAVPSTLLYNFLTFRVGPNNTTKADCKDSIKIAFSQWVRLYLAPLVPNDFWARLLSRVIADKSYLATLQNYLSIYLSIYLKTYQSSEDEQTVADMTNSLRWKVWNNGLGLYIGSDEILQVSYLLLPSLHFTDLYLVDQDPRIQHPNKGEFSEGVHVLVREWKGIKVDAHKLTTAKPNIHNKNTEIMSEPSVSLQLATWLLQRSAFHVEEVFDEWQRRLYSIRRSLFQGMPHHFKCYIPCPKCYHSHWKHIDPLSKISGDLGVQEENEQNIRPQTIYSNSQGNVNETPEPIREFLVYSIVYLCRLARDGKDFSCPVHGYVKIAYLIPDILFQDLPGKMVYNMQRVKMTKLIGEGGYSRVFRGKVFSMITSQEQEIAVKEFILADYSLTNLENMDEQIHLMYKSCSIEVRVLAQLRHVNIIQMVGVTLSPYCILMEIAPQGDLNKIIKLYNRAKSYISSFAIAETCKQVASALAYLHSLLIVYRDLKPSNILVFEYPQPVTEQSITSAILVKVADYGISAFLAPYAIKDVGGTEKYMAPEILKKSGELSKPVDVYSFGLVIFCLITLETPFVNEPIPMSKHQTMKGARPEVPTKARPRAIYLMDLMRWCWAQNPTERPTFVQIEEVCSKESFQRLLFACRVTKNKRNPTCACLVQSTSKQKSNPTLPLLRKQRSSSAVDRDPMSRRKQSFTPTFQAHVSSSLSAGNLCDLEADKLLEVSESSCDSKKETISPERRNRENLNLEFNVVSPTRSPLITSGIESLTSEEGSLSYTPMDEDMIPSLKQFTAVTNLKQVVTSAFTNSQLWYGTGEGNLNFFEVLEKEFRVKGAQKFSGSRIHCMVSAGNYVWIGTDNTGLHIFYIKSHKRVGAWVQPGKTNGSHHRQILSLSYVVEFDYVIASSSSGSLFVFSQASHPVVDLVPTCIVDQEHAGVCMTLARPLGGRVEMWCGSDEFKIIRYSCESDGTLEKFSDVLTFQGPKEGNRFNIEQIWSFEEKDKVICSVGSVLGQLSLTKAAWIKFVNTSRLIGCSPYQARVTAMTGYQGLLYVGTGHGAILIIEPEDVSVIGRIHEYSEPVRVLIPTESNFNRLVYNPNPSARHTHTQAGADTDLNKHKRQSLLISIGLSYSGITRVYINAPKTLEPVVEWSSNEDHEPTKPDSDDGYLLIFSLKGWASPSVSSRTSLLHKQSHFSLT